MWSRKNPKSIQNNLIKKHLQEAPPEQSCTNIMDTTNINFFEAVSVEFELDEAAATLDSFPEDRFRDQIASYLKLDTVYTYFPFINLSLERHFDCARSLFGEWQKVCSPICRDQEWRLGWW